MEAIATALLFALAQKLTDTFKAIRDRAWSSLLTQVGAFVAGVLAVALAAASDLGPSIELGGSLSLSDLNGASQVFVGLTLGSLGSVAHDTLATLGSRNSSTDE